ncbi:proline dehydrogenase family protein [Microscilla marina]|uniref:Proline oxidase n=1 Tax=Microscilla marina ATCC 23134 TaxID=313606 RepID=A1ZPK7_MICM2|nr:proline dehydrogenase family protein [Microscilla marina]EAY27746.1 proline oxidase [Microscilla marina ATCC 23134]
MEITRSKEQDQVLSFEDTSVAFAHKSNKELRKMYWLFAMMNRRLMVKTGTGFVKWAFKFRLPVVKWAVKNTVFAHFCGGQSIEDSQKTIDTLARFNIGTILDYSVEGEKTEESFEQTARETILTIEKAAQQPEKIPFCVFKVTGLASFDLLAKVQANDQLSETEQQAWQRAQQRIDNVCQQAYEKKVRIFIDGEETWIQDTIDQLAYTMMQKYNRDMPIIYNTYQMYRVASLANLKQAYKDAEQNNYWLGAKLVRGAYMEKERARAEEKGYSDPIQPNKAASDKDFDAGITFCVEKRHQIALCAGTHNEQSSLLLTQLMDQYGVAKDDPNTYFSQLFGMSDHISFNLAKAGYNVAKYVPYGPIASVMPYLIRRADENTSVAGQSSREFMLIQAERKRRKAK